MVLKVAEPEGLEAFRLLLRRYEPVSTVSTVSKLVVLLTTTFCGDLMDSLSHFERRVTSWEHEAKETLSDLIKIGVVIKGLEKGWFRDHLLINTAGTTECTKKHTACSDGFVGNDQSRSKAPRKLFMVWNLRPHGERLSKEKLNTSKTTKRVDGLARTTSKGKPGKGKGKQDKGKGKGKPSDGKEQRKG